jgi:hypothetical protein
VEPARPRHDVGDTRSLGSADANGTASTPDDEDDRSTHDHQPSGNDLDGTSRDGCPTGTSSDDDRHSV